MRDWLFPAPVFRACSLAACLLPPAHAEWHKQQRDLMGTRVIDRAVARIASAADRLRRTGVCRNSAASKRVMSSYIETAKCPSSTTMPRSLLIEISDEMARLIEKSLYFSELSAGPSILPTPASATPTTTAKSGPRRATIARDCRPSITAISSSTATACAFANRQRTHQSGRYRQGLCGRPRGRNRRGLRYRAGDDQRRRRQPHPRRPRRTARGSSASSIRAIRPASPCACRCPIARYRPRVITNAFLSTTANAFTTLSIPSTGRSAKGQLERHRDRPRRHDNRRLIDYYFYSGRGERTCINRKP